MDLTQSSSLLLFLLVIPITLFVITAVISYKGNRKCESILKPITILLFLVLFTFMFRLGINTEEIYVGNNRLVNLVAFSSAVQLMVANFNVDLVAKAMNNNVYNWLFHLGGFSGSLFVLYNVLTFIYRKASNAIKISLYSMSNRIYIYGDDLRLNSFLNSLNNNLAYRRTFFGMFKSKITKIVVLKDSNINKEICNKTINHLYIAEKDINIETFKITDIIKVKSKKNYKFISLVTNDKTNIIFLNKIYEYLDVKNDTYTDNMPSTKSFDAYIPFQELDNFDLITLNQKFKQIVHFYSYETIVSYDLVLNNPIINKSKTKKHFVFVGFGATNRQIYKNYLSVNVIDDHVKYTIITNDKINVWNRFLRNLYYDNSNLSKEGYFTPPKVNCIYKDTKSIECNVNNIEFSDKLEEELDGNREVYFFVAIGSDIKNIMATQILFRNIKFKHKLSTYHIFTRVKDRNLDITKYLSDSKGTLSIFGSNESIYTYTSIVNEEHSYLAMKIHEALYDTLWSNMSYYEKHSSLFAVSSIRNKLRSLGFDLAKSGESVTKEDYYKKYEPETEKLEWVCIKDITKVDRYYLESVRHTLARYEHSRWNLYMILEGFVPMSLDELKQNLNDLSDDKNPGKNLETKRHICITTYNQLRKYTEIIDDFNKKNNRMKKIDYILPDFKVMDELPKILENTDYKIVNYL